MPKASGVPSIPYKENTAKITVRAYGEIEFIPAITVDEVGEMMKPKRGRPAKEQK